MQLYLKFLKFFGMNIVGTPRYIGIDVVFDDFNLITLNERVVISNNCHFLTHDYSLTTALISIGEKPSSDMSFFGEIIVGKNVFIGKKSIVLPNTTIGDNVIVGAGSIVRGKIPSNSIIAGNPARVIANIKDTANSWKGSIKEAKSD